MNGAGVSIPSEPQDNEIRSPRARGAWKFFLLVFCLSHVVVLWPMVFLGITITSPLGAIGVLLGGSAPSLSGIYLTWRDGGRAGLRNLWRRVTQFHIGWRWYLAILLVPFLLRGSQFLFYVGRGGEMLPGALPSRIVADPLTVLLLIAQAFLIGPLMEELGWRGYALDHLLSKWNALTSSVILGVLWGLWHLPLFFLTGSSFSEVEPLGLAITAFIIAIVPLTVLYTWLHNNTARSVWTALLFHTTNRLASETLGSLISPGRADYVVEMVAAILMGAIVVTIWGKATLVRRTL